MFKTHSSMVLLTRGFGRTWYWSFCLETTATTRQKPSHGADRPAPRRHACRHAGCPACATRHTSPHGWPSRCHQCHQSTREAASPRYFTARARGFTHHYAVTPAARKARALPTSLIGQSSAARHRRHRVGTTRSTRSSGTNKVEMRSATEPEAHSRGILREPSPWH